MAALGSSVVVAKPIIRIGSDKERICWDCRTGHENTGPTNRISHGDSYPFRNGTGT